MHRWKFAALAFGVVSYAIFFLTFLYAIGFVSNLFVAKTIDAGQILPPGRALIIDLLLLSIFALQHSIMARQSFKRWWTQWVPRSIERSTYVLFSSLALILLFWQWRPIPAVVWQISNPQLANAAIALSFVGWGIVLISTFLINHFELFGLRQVASNFTNKAMPEPRFRTPLLYQFVRHPIYFGFIVAFWATPMMTVGHLVFAVGSTAYILLGILLEERDLVALFGDDYRHYQNRVSMLVPWRKSA